MSAIRVWTQEQVEGLKRFWAEGHTSVEIGKRIRIGEDACLAVAHMLKLPRRTGRPSRAKQPPKVLPWNPPHPADPWHPLDKRTLEIFDMMADFGAVEDVAAHFKLPESVVREKWRVYTLQRLVPEVVA